MLSDIYKHNNYYNCYYLTKILSWLVHHAKHRIGKTYCNGFHMTVKIIIFVLFWNSYISKYLISLKCNIQIYNVSD